MPYCSSCGTQTADHHNFCPKCGQGANSGVAVTTTASAAAVQRAESEISFMAEGNVRVTNSRFISGGQTYAMSGITSVKQDVQKPKYGGLIILGLIGFITLAIGGNAVWIGLLMMVIAIAVGISLKADYFVILHSSSGEMKALTSKDKEFISRVVDAINQAIVFRR